MTSIISIKQEAENLPDFHSNAIKQFELKEKIIFLAYLLAKMKIALVTYDEEKLMHGINKFLHGDICSIEKVKSDLARAKKLYKGKTIIPYEECIKKIEEEFALLLKDATQ